MESRSSRHIGKTRPRTRSLDAVEDVLLVLTLRSSRPATLLDGDDMAPPTANEHDTYPLLVCRINGAVSIGSNLFKFLQEPPVHIRSRWAESNKIRGSILF